MISRDFLFTRTHQSLDERQKQFCANLRLDIKRQLLGHRKADPHICITRDIQIDTYEQLFGTQTKRRFLRNSDLNDVLGTSWMERFNKNRECCYVITGTATISLHRHRPVSEFNSTGKETVSYAGYFVKFEFVRGDATEAEVTGKSSDLPWRQ